MELKRHLLDRTETNSNGCFLWKLAKNSVGYGTVTVKSHQYSVHRLMYTVCNGSIPAGLHVLHKCDVRNCINPNHLFLGTNADNMRDKCLKGRQANGSKNGNSKLKKEEVEEIRSSKDRPYVVARRFGISYNHLLRIKKRQVWANI